VTAHDNGGYWVVWEFKVKPEAQLAFEQIYGPNGAWVRLFRYSADFRGTRLLRDLSLPGHYLTFDRWTSREALHDFKRVHQADYDALDQQCESMTENESLVGEFDSLFASSTG
jgi:hypothetical protein